MTLKFWPNIFESQARLKYINFRHIFITFIVLTFRRLNLFFAVYYKFRTSSPPTSCYRLGLCLSTPSRSWWSRSLPALKIGRRSRVRERKRSSNFIIHQLIKIIYLNQDLYWQQICCFWQTGCVQRYWVTVDGLTNTIRVIDMRCLDIRAEP